MFILFCIFTGYTATGNRLQATGYRQEPVTSNQQPTFAEASVGEASNLTINCQTKYQKIMAGGDRTGPMGQGPLTGRRSGLCAGFDSPGNTKGPGGGMGRGFSFGRGMGFGRGMARGRGFGRGLGFRGRKRLADLEKGKE